MARRRKLDPFVSAFVDVRGKERFRFRRGGVSRYLPPPGSPEYKAEYQNALENVPKIERAIPKSIADLVARYYRSVEFRQTGAHWQATMKAYMEPFREKAGAIPVADFKPRHIERELADKMEQTVVKGRKFGGTAAAQRLHEMLNRLFKYAESLEWIEENPVKKVKVPKHKVKGFTPWNEADIAKFRRRWPLGTKARLAMELMLWTGARRGDAHLMAPPQNGWFLWQAAKTGKLVEMPVVPPLQAAIDAMPEVGREALIVTEFGKPFSRAGFGNWFGDRCRDAGLEGRTAHGLRKALTRRAADLNVSQQGLKALGQWENDAEVRTYADSANRNRMAEDALMAVVAWERETNIG